MVRHHRRKVVWLSVIVDEKTIDCGVSIEALRDHFGAYVDDPLPAFRSRRARIQEITAKLITERRLEDDGTVIWTGGALKLAEVGIERLSATWHLPAEDRR
jgi:hypothetical protein